MIFPIFIYKTKVLWDRDIGLIRTYLVNNFIKKKIGRLVVLVAPTGRSYNLPRPQRIFKAEYNLVP